eukprot:TRINITY_DN66602_c0_g1_i1.p1 TRINITY_DN66602_c0_g1~~TRINITY_DN66602_c0_g1_i1.p1  ORF type:complete len:281 (+),score=39.05 TRINITY_DN66602_c0_g1_i1:64-906(+)
MSGAVTPHREGLEELAAKRRRLVRVRRLTLPGGILDQAVLQEVEAIAQQSNCVGCDGRGLAEAIRKSLPYGDTYHERRRLPPANKFAVEEDRPRPGTIAVRAPPPSADARGRPAVISMFAQWEMGPPLKYNRVKPPSGVGADSKANRETWFRECLGAIGKLEPKPASIAFPHKIGCGLAGGDWSHYEAMLLAWADEHPDIEITICSMPEDNFGVGSNTMSSSSGNRRYLYCKFSEKDEVKRLGGRWDPAARKWYVPEGLALQTFSRWLDTSTSSARKGEA